MGQCFQLLIVCFFFAVTPGPTEGADVITATEDSDVVLPCSLSSKQNLESKLFDWKKDVEKEVEKRVFMYDGGLFSGRDFEDQDKQFEGRVSYFPDELKKGNASIKITKTKVSDSGTYTCIFPRLQLSQTFSVQLVVEGVFKDRSAENGAASPKPFIKELNQTKDQAQLQCEVYGASPKPVVVWRDSSGNILPAEEPQVTERGGSYDIILQTNVTENDFYSCVVTQEEIKHQTEAKTYVFIYGKAMECSSAPVDVGSLVAACLVAGCLAGAVILVASQFLAVKLCSALRHKVIHILSGLKPQPDSKQQNGKCNINDYTMNNAPADQPDSSELFIQPSNEDTPREEDV